MFNIRRELHCTHEQTDGEVHCFAADRASPICNMPVLMQYSKALTGQCVWAYKVWLPVGVYAALRGVGDKPLLAALDRTQHLGTAYRLMNMHTYLVPSE